MIEILKKPIDLNNEELKKIYESATTFSFDKWIIDDLKIERDLYSIIPTIYIVCDNTGFSLTIKGEYNIEITSSIGHKSMYNTIDLMKCLIEIGAVKYN
jgi:hypothetical protein